MRHKHILVTGGTGFIGSFLVDRLVEEGYKVRIIDNLEEQVHQGKAPSYLNKKAEFIKTDVRDYNAFKKALRDIEVVFHLAARVGVAQSNYGIKDYVGTNIGGMANLLDVIVNTKNKVKKIIMTASMTSYGEGDYKCSSCGIVKPSLRSKQQMRSRDWEMRCPHCKKRITPIPTDENSRLNNNSIYSLTKRTQEEMLLYIGKTYGIPVVSLRCFNVYGPRQSLSNPYTGVTAIFISRLKNNNQPVVYEDGLQTRDFVSVHDVVDALITAMNPKSADYEMFNIGSGKPRNIKQVAQTLASLMGKNIQPKISGEYRLNDIRHCYADITKVRNLLGWKPRISFEEGMRELINWSEMEKAQDLFAKATKELREKKLIYEKI